MNGVWVNVRPKADKIAIWTKSARNSEAQLNIGNKIKEILSLKDQALTYEVYIFQVESYINTDNFFKSRCIKTTRNRTLVLSTPSRRQSQLYTGVCVWPK